MSDLKTKTVTIEFEGKDKGKSFLITEMPLIQADRWAWGLGHGMLQGGLKGADIDVNKLDFKTNGGILEFAKLGVSALGGIDEDKLFRLLDELTENCIQIIPSNGIARSIVDGDIASIKTLNYLRIQAIDVHIDFLKEGGYLS